MADGVVVAPWVEVFPDIVCACLCSSGAYSSSPESPPAPLKVLMASRSDARILASPDSIRVASLVA